MFILMQFGPNRHLLIFSKTTRAYLVQVALKIVRLPLRIGLYSVVLP